MTVLVDTGVLYADHDLDASRHDAATRALEAVFDGEFGQPYVSDHIYDEAVTLTLKRSGRWPAANELGKKLRGRGSYPRTYEFCHVTPAVFTDAVGVFEQYDDQHLSFTDATSIAVLERHDIDRLLSFDDDFDGIVDRMPPAEV